MRYVGTMAAVVLLMVTTAIAGVPRPDAGHLGPGDPADPSRSTVELRGQGTTCHYRFRMDGGLDRLTVVVTLRDAFDKLIPDCSTSVSLTPNAGTIAFDICCPPTKGGVSDASGALQVEFFQLGGRGTLDVCLTVRCDPHQGYPLGRHTIDFTTPDLDASGGDNPVVDLGLWAACFPPSPYCEWSDYTCDGTVDILDLGVWAGGLGLACGQTECP